MKTEKSFAASSPSLVHLDTRISEGIETVEQGTMLRNMGYRYGQGYAIARPLPAEQVLAWLQDWQAPVQWQTRATSKNDKLTQVLQPINK